jgi:RNA polymerase sigma-70 factor, ECF subfamily
MAKDLSPEELDLLNKGDIDIFKKVYTTYEDELYVFITKYVRTKFNAENLFTDTFLAFWNRKKKFGSNAHLNNYLYTAAKHRIADYHKSRKQKNPFIDLSEPPNYVEDQESFDPFEELEAKTTKEYLHEIFFKAIKDMSPDQKKILAFHLQGKQPVEIAELMNMDVKKARDHLFRIKKKIKAFLEKNKDNPSFGSLCMLLFHILF